LAIDFGDGGGLVYFTSGLHYTFLLVEVRRFVVFGYLIAFRGVVTEKKGTGITEVDSITGV
jgi:hypothetical protein